MRDWVVAIVLGVILVGLAIAAPVLGALISLLLAPTLYLVVAILVIWFLLQILKDGGSREDGKGPDP